MKMEVAVDSDSLAIYALDMVKSEPDPAAVIMAANKRQIFALARANIQSFGQDTAVNNHGSLKIPADDLEAVKNHVRAVFPEID
jgi:hypothetical protein